MLINPNSTSVLHPLANGTRGVTIYMHILCPHSVPSRPGVFLQHGNETLMYISMQGNAEVNIFGYIILLLKLLLTLHVTTVSHTFLIHTDMFDLGARLFFKLLVYSRFHSVQAISRLDKFIL